MTHEIEALPTFWEALNILLGMVTLWQSIYDAVFVWIYSIRKYLIVYFCVVSANTVCLIGLVRNSLTLRYRGGYCIVICCSVCVLESFTYTVF